MDSVFFDLHRRVHILKPRILDVRFAFFYTYKFCMWNVFRYQHFITIVCEMRNLQHFKVFGLILIAGVLVVHAANATTYYSRVSGGNWNDANSWSTVTYGDATNTGTYPRSSADIANIGDGYTHYLNLTVTVGSVNVGQGTSGLVEFANGSAYTLSVINNMVINTGGKLWYNSNSSRTHLIQIGGNLTNNGTLDLYSDADDVVNLTFNRSANSVVSGAGTYDLNTVTMSKLTSTGYYVDVTSSQFESAIRDLVTTFGTYIHHNTGTYSVNSSGGSAYTIGSDVVFKVQQGTLHLSENYDEVTLQGSIIVNGGTLKIGSTAGVGGLRYDKNGSFVPKVDLQSGTMRIYGGVNYKTGNSTDPFSFSMSGGTLLLNEGSTGTAISPFQINDVTGSVFLMTDGIVQLFKPNTTGNTISDFSLCGINGNITSGGGTIVFGDVSTPDASIFSFTPFTGKTLPNLKITGDNSKTITLAPENNSTSDIKCLGLYIDYNKTFDLRAVAGSTGDSRSLFITANLDGINAIYNDGTLISRTSTLVLQGGEGQQLSGNSAFDLYNFTISNTSGATLATMLNISGNLVLTDGVIFANSSAYIVMQPGSVNDVGSASSFIDGPFKVEVTTSGNAVLNFPIGKDLIYRPLTLNVNHTSAALAGYQFEMMNNAATGLNYSLPPSLERVSSIRYYAVARTGSSNLTDAQLDLSYDADDVVNDFSNLRIAIDNGASSWMDLGGSGSSNLSGTIASGSFNAFYSQIAIANSTGGVNQLPVSFIGFDAIIKNDGVYLKWSTASENNSDYFTLERSADGVHFEKISEVNAAGNSNVLKQYSSVDRSNFSGLMYYRIRETDFDGSEMLSAVRSVKGSNRASVLMYPNPAQSSGFNLSNIENHGASKVEMINLNGQLVLEENLPVGVKNYHVQPKHQLIPGQYLIKIIDDRNVIYSELLIVSAE